MKLLKRLFGGKAASPEYTPEDLESMRKLQKAIPGSSLPTLAPKKSMISGGGLTKQIDTRTMAQKAHEAKQAMDRQWDERQELMAKGMKPHEAANEMARRELAARHTQSKSWTHFHPPTTGSS